MAEKGLFCGINKPKDASNLTDMEKKHIPVIEAPDEVRAGEPFTATIKVGELPHVSEEAHHIQWIDVYFGQNFYTRVELTPVFTRPSVTVTLVRHGKGTHKVGTMRVVERCNIHGLWESTKDITVTE
jgi:superoxide reductase